MNLGHETRRRELAFLVALLLLVLAWDATGWDWAVTQALATPTGFPWRHAWLTEALLHQGLRTLSLLAFCGLAIWVWRLPKVAVGSSPNRRAAGFAFLAALVIVLLVPLLKARSLTSCPWSLEAFGGTARYVSHWRWGVADGGPGGCFPAGHPTSALAFVSLLWLWAPFRHQRPLVFWGLCASVLGFTLLASGTQVARGAHFVSHALWSAWLAAALSWVVLRLTARAP
jgi:membrane-associated PAP2 superfamily phosphatase